jgi:predicted DNA repair protein MutK
MREKSEIKPKNNRKINYPKILLIAAFTAAIIGVVLLVNNVYLFIYYVNEYVASGYAVSMVVKSLLTTQLIPGIAEPVVLYGGMALILLSIHKIIDKTIGGNESAADVAEDDKNKENLADVKNNE